LSQQDAHGRRARSSGLATVVGPEILTAAADNDPTNVGTAVLVGARTGYQLSWIALLVAPLLAVVLAIAAQVGIVARNDLQSLVAKRYGHRLARLLMVSVVTVNLVTIAADLQAGAAGIGILAGVRSAWFVVPLGVALVLLLLVGKYDEVVTVLRYVLLGFLAFGAAAVLARPDWLAVLRASFIPALSLRPADLTGATALLGTTLTTYVYLWETIAVGVEEPRSAGGSDLRELRRSRTGAIVGAVSTAVILWLMLITSAATLGIHHRSVSTAQDAALALRPLAGTAAADLFAAGLITSAIVALPVLMASTAHVIGAEFNWRRGLSGGITQARGFYVVLAASIALAGVVDLAGVPLLYMLVAASIIGGVATPIGLVLMVRIARDPDVMGESPISPRLAAAGWAVAVIAAGIAVVFLVGSAVML
jgi:NRAMP (natural resistance-associated macrophage protein)-like metal ion transporter